MSDKNKIADEGSDTNDFAAELADLKEQLSKVNSKNAELVREKQAMKIKAQEAQDAADEAAEKVERDAKDIEALEKRLTAKFEKEITALKAERDTLTGELRTVRVDNEITKALSEGKVLDHQIEPLTYMFKAKAQFANGEATIDGKSIAEFVGTYLGSEVGANFRRPADNSGSGATGNTSTTVVKDHGFTRENFSAREGEWMVLAGKDPATAKQAALDVGRADLASTL